MKISVKNISIKSVKLPRPFVYLVSSCVLKSNCLYLISKQSQQTMISKCISQWLHHKDKNIFI